MLLLKRRLMRIIADFLIYYFPIYEVRFNAQIVDGKLSNCKLKNPR